MRVITACVCALGFTFAGPAVKSSAGTTDDETAFTPIDRGFEIRTPSLEVWVRDASIVRIVNRRTGEVHADDAAGGIAIPAGIGTLGSDPGAMRSLLSTWATRPVVDVRNEAAAFPSQHAPDARWSAEVRVGTAGASAVWRSPQGDPLRCEITLKATVDTGGDEVEFTMTASAAGGGLYGVALPLRNLHADHAAYVASFGGIRIPGGKFEGLTSLSSAPFAEAPAIALEGRKGSIGFWLPTNDMRPYALFVGSDRRQMAVAIESLESMPYEGIDRSRKCVWRLGVADGDWRSALMPYRQQYMELFAKQIATRDGTVWAPGIQVILDEIDGTRAAFAAVASRLPPETVLIHEWNARSLPFGKDLPDWTPGTRFLATVRLAHEFGFRAMGYVNTYCVNVGSPVFERDAIRGFGLVRPLPGPWGYGLARESFASAKPGQMLYLDPLSAPWRNYHIEQMRQWIAATNSDALYEDVGGTAGDFGNGKIDGLEGAQGGTEQFRELKERLPQVPLATEFAPEHMAFASNWPLRYQQVWGSQAVRDDWLWNQRPVARFLHGGRSWTPTVNAYTERDRFLVVASSDALGGVAQFPAREHELEATAGICAHMLERAELFARRRLQPSDRPMALEPGTACEYRASDGETLLYRAEFPRQELLDGSGRPVYQRVFGATSIDSPLRIPGWPGVAGDTTIGLNPASPYALSRRSDRSMLVKVLGLPEGAFIKRYVESGGAVTLTIDGPAGAPGANRKMSVSLATPASSAWVDGRRVDLTPPGLAMKVELPRYPTSFVAFTGPVPKCRVGEPLGRTFEPGCFVAAAAGIERGGSYTPPKRTAWIVGNETDPRPFMFLNGGADSEIQFDFAIEVPGKDASVEVVFRSSSKQFGNGSRLRVLVDGIEAASALVGTVQAGDRPGTSMLTDVVRITVPVGGRAGTPISVSVVGDGRGNDNADELWFAQPRLVSDPAQRKRIESLGQPRDSP